MHVNTLDNGSGVAITLPSSCVQSSSSPAPENTMKQDFVIPIDGEPDHFRRSLDEDDEVLFAVTESTRDPLWYRLWCNKRCLGSFLVIFSAFMFSIMTLIVDLTGEKGIPSFQMMVIRCIIQTFYSGFMAYWAGVNMFGEPGERTLPLLRGVFGPLATGALYFGATHIAMADATVLKFTSPIWTVIIARIVLGERVQFLKVVAILLGFAGVVCVAQPDFLLDMVGYESPNSVVVDPSKDVVGSASYMFSIAVCLIGAACSACVYVIVRKSGGSVHFHVLGFYYGFVGIFSSTILLFVLQGMPVWPEDMLTWLSLLAIAVCGCVAQTCFNKGAQMIEASKSAAFRSTDVGFVLCWQIIFLHELPTWWSVAGIILICLCTLIMASMKGSKSPQKPQEEEEERYYELDTVASGLGESLMDEELQPKDCVFLETPPMPVTTSFPLPGNPTVQ